MTGWGRWAIALTGAVILAVSLAAQLALAFLFTLCGLSESEAAPARLTPVLLGGPLLTVIWAVGMLFRYAQ